MKVKKANKRLSKNQTREYSLDVLKCISTILIIFHHYQQLTGVYFENGINFWGGCFYWGYIVELFFILSGYFSLKYVNCVDENSKIIPFFRKKYFRFLPMLIITGTVCIILEYVYYVQICNKPFPYSLGIVIGSILGISRWIKCSLMVNNPTWYISVLLLCYLLLFITTYLAKKIKINPFIFYALVLIIGTYMRTVCNLQKICYPFFSEAIGRGYSCFFYGILFRKVMERFQKVKTYQNIFIEVAGFLVFAYVFNKNLLTEDRIWFVLVFYLYPILILFFKNRVVEEFINKWKLAALGEISYNAFMWHLPIIWIVIIFSYYSNMELIGIKSMIITLGLVFMAGGITVVLKENIVSKRCNIEWLRKE